MVWGEVVYWRKGENPSREMLWSLGLIQDTVRAPYNTTSGRDCVKSLRLCLHGNCPQSVATATDCGAGECVVAGHSATGCPSKMEEWMFESAETEFHCSHIQ